MLARISNHECESIENVPGLQINRFDVVRRFNGQVAGQPNQRRLRGPSPVLPQSHPSFAALHPTTVAILEDIVDRPDRTSTFKVMASGYNVVPDVLHSTIARISYHGQDDLQNVPGVQVNRVDVVRRLSRRTTSV